MKKHRFNIYGIKSHLNKLFGKSKSMNSAPFFPLTVFLIPFIFVLDFNNRIIANNGIIVINSGRLGLLKRTTILNKIL